jgi:hypothetical protein
MPGNHLIVARGSIGGIDDLRLIIDTGTGLELISKSLAERLKVSQCIDIEVPRLTGELVPMELGTVSGIKLGGVNVQSDWSVGVTDLLDRLLRDFGTIDGAISLRALADHPFTIDFADQMLIFEDEQSVAALASSGLVVGVNFDQAGPEVLTISAQVEAFEKYRGRFAIDTATATTILNKTAMEALGLREDSLNLKRVQGWSVTGQPQTRFYGQLAGLVAINNFTTEENPSVCFQKLNCDGVIGLNFFKGKTVTFDLPRRRLIFQ